MKIIFHTKPKVEFPFEEEDLKMYQEEFENLKENGANPQFNEMSFADYVRPLKVTIEKLNKDYHGTHILYDFLSEIVDLEDFNEITRMLTEKTRIELSNEETD